MQRRHTGADLFVRPIKMIKMKNNSKRGMTLNEMLSLVTIAIATFSFAIYMNATHLKICGAVAVPFGFCSGAYLVCILHEISLRQTCSPWPRTPTPIILKALVQGLACGVAAGSAFYVLAIHEAIPTVQDATSRMPLSACLCGLSVAFTAALLAQSIRMNRVRKMAQKPKQQA